MKDKIRIFTPELRDTKGLTILELAVAMIIMGVIIAGLLSIINPMIESGKIKETERKMERIVDVMAIYAQRNNRIPVRPTLTALWPQNPLARKSVAVRTAIISVPVTAPAI